MDKKINKFNTLTYSKYTSKYTWLRRMQHVGVSPLEYNGSSDHLFCRSTSFSKIELLQFISHAFGSILHDGLIAFDNDYFALW